MKVRFPLHFLFFGLATAVIITSMTAVAATNTIPFTRIGTQAISFNINHLKPSACAGISLTSLIIASGTLAGTEGNDLILGGPGADTIDGLGGNDCMVGGGGDDIITGGEGTDVCLGGPGNDVFVNCEGESQ